MNPADRIARMVAVTLRYPRITLLCAVLVTGLGVLGLTTARVDSTLAGMLGGSNPAANALARIADHFHTAEELLVLVSAPPGTTTEDAQADLVAYAERFTSSAGADPGARKLIEAVRYRPNIAFETYFREVVLPHGTAYLDHAAFDAFLRRLEPDGVQAQMRQNEAMLAAPGPGAGVLARELVKDPLRLRDFVRDSLGESGTGLGESWFSDDGCALLIRIAGRRPVNDLEFSKALTACVERLVTDAQPRTLRVELGGGYAVAATSASAIRADAISSALFAVVALLVFFVFIYRNPVTAILLMAAASVGIIAAFGAFTYFTGTITPLTAVLASMLAGLGVDCAIHFHTRHNSLTSGGLQAFDASVRTTRELFVPMLAVLITTVCGFGAVALGEVRMLRDFAMLGCLGLAGSITSVYLVLPSMLECFRPRRLASASYTGVAWCVHAIAVRPKTVLVSSLLLPLCSATMIAMTPGFLPPFETDPSVMHPQPNAPLETGRHVRERFNSIGESLLVHIRADSSVALIERCHDVRRALATPDATRVGVRSTRGLAELLPDPREAAVRIESLSKVNAREVVDEVRHEMEHGPFQAGSFDDYLDFLGTLLTVTHAPGVQELRRHPVVAAIFLPRNVLEDPSTELREAMTIVMLSPSASSRGVRHDAIQGVRRLITEIPGATLTGITVVSRDLEHATRRDLARFSGVSIFLVVAWLYGMYRRIRTVLLALAPVVFSLLFVFGMMSVLGLHLNTVNITAMPLLAGIAVDSGILLESAARRIHQSNEDPVEALIPTIHATLCTSGTTAIGFGTLVWTQTPAVQSLGVAFLVGIIASVVGVVGFVTPMLLLACRPTYKDAV